MKMRHWLLLGLLLCTATCPSGSRAEGIRTSYENSTLSVYLPGSYLSYDAFRAPSPDGPWTVLTANNTNCLNGCGWNDQAVEPGSTYYYRFEAISTDRVRASYGPLGVQVPIASLSPRTWPNPSRGAVRFQVQVPPSAGLTSRVRAAIYDASGRRVRDLGSVESLPGSRQLDWDGKDEAGRTLQAGVYFYRVLVGDRSAGGSLVRIR